MWLYIISSGEKMVEKISLYLENLGPIRKADIDLSKITVIGGENVSGKSTLSKFIYSFLRSNSSNRQQISYTSISDEIMEVSRYVMGILRKNNVDDELFEYFKSEKFNINDSDNFADVINNYELMKDKFYSLKLSLDDFEYVNKKLLEIDEVIRIVQENQDDLYFSLMRGLLQSEFSTKFFNTYSEITTGQAEYVIDLKSNDIFSNDAFKVDGAISLSEVFYMDSVSILDSFEAFKIPPKRHVDHIEFLKSSLVGDKTNQRTIFDDKFNREIIEIEDRISKLINGKFIFKNGEFLFVSNGVEFVMHNTSSGIKQIGIIQLLLANRHLKENSFLIIDEPEVNLHPEWQIKFAEILVLLSKKLNINVFINSHSPMFMEALSLYSQLYEIDGETNFYITKKCDDNRFTFFKVDNSDMASVYNAMSDIEKYNVNFIKLYE